MAFVFTAFGHPPEFDCEETSERCVIYTARIGYDNISDTLYSAAVQLDWEDGEAIFIFALAEQDEREGSEFILSSNEANSIVPSHYRSLVLWLICYLAEELLEVYKPNTFSMTTYLSHLPPKALAKYETLCETFKNCGYEMSHEGPLEGHHTWRANHRR